MPCAVSFGASTQGVIEQVLLNAEVNLRFPKSTASEGIKVIRPAVPDAAELCYRVSIISPDYGHSRPSSAQPSLATRPSSGSQPTFVTLPAHQIKRRSCSTLNRETLRSFILQTCEMRNGLLLPKVASLISEQFKCFAYIYL
ncbi:unnamed protein product [Protopolystoma xenopodis]|uniref:Uncharacterized protein n=1 Tax=Protopolystoma xenopodis TaxID=117903 RepID=A0A3S5AA61_9PLAT|nr:unnamed protein product [Protopolystoma xenopodis]